MSASVFAATCPECAKDLRAPSSDEIQRRMARHARNCAGLRRVPGLSIAVERLPPPIVLPPARVAWWRRWLAPLLAWWRA